MFFRWCDLCLDLCSLHASWILCQSLAGWGPGRCLGWLLRLNALVKRFALADPLVIRLALSTRHVLNSTVGQTTSKLTFFRHSPLEMPWCSCVVLAFHRMNVVFVCKKSTREYSAMYCLTYYWFSSGKCPMYLTCLFICKRALFVYWKYIGRLWANLSR